MTNPVKETISYQTHYAFERREQEGSGGGGEGRGVVSPGEGRRWVGAVVTKPVVLGGTV